MYTNKRYNIVSNLKIIIPIVIFMVISLMSIYSSQNLLSSSYNNLYIKQLIWYLIGFICILIISKSKNNILIDNPYIFYIIGNILLIFVLFFGTELNGAKCWFTIPKLGSFQPSEFVKIFLILVLAKELNKYENNNKRRSFKGELIIIGKCLLITLIPSVLIFLEPDTGIIFIFLSILIIMLFVYGIRYRWFISIGIFLIIVLGIFLILFFNYQELFINIFGTNFFYRMDRLLDWQNGSGMQLTNALAATGSAGLFGHGYMNTPIYFPEPQTDFIFSIISEELGILGIISVSILFLIIILRCTKISVKAPCMFSKMLSFGITFQLAFQTLLNLAVVVGLIPVTGVTLPFFSYGGSSLLITLVSMGIVLNISRYEK